MRQQQRLTVRTCQSTRMLFRQSRPTQWREGNRAHAADACGLKRHNGKRRHAQRKTVLPFHHHTTAHTKRIAFRPRWAYNEKASCPAAHNGLPHRRQARRIVRKAFRQSSIVFSSSFPMVTTKYNPGQLDNGFECQAEQRIFPVRHVVQPHIRQHCTCHVIRALGLDARG